LQNIEIEYKNLLTKNEYKRLLSALPFPEKGMKQINYYFETADLQLARKKCALRIREKNNKYTLTIKEPHPDGILETHATLTEEEAEQWIKGKPVLKPTIEQQLRSLQISPKELISYGNLTTFRRSILIDRCELVIDHSKYNDRHDFELELEAPDQKTGKALFQNILKTYNIQQRKVKNKIERFFSTLPDKYNR